MYSAIFMFKFKYSTGLEIKSISVVITRLILLFLPWSGMLVFCRFLFAPPPKFHDTSCCIAILRWVGQNPGKVWGPTPVNVVFSITTRFHFWLNTFQVAVYYNFRFDLFLFLDGRIRRIRHRYREKVSLVLAAFVNTIHFLIRWK